MGLYINHLNTITFTSERTLYVYLLSYGWPDGEWENIFKKHFMKMADRASETGAAVISSPRGVHFANEVLDYHRVGSLDASKVLPGLLITKTDPTYFKETLVPSSSGDKGMCDLLVIPLKGFCTNENEFVTAIERIFSDLIEGKTLREFEVAAHDIVRPKSNYQNLRAHGGQAANAIELKPNVFGVGVDLKKLFGWGASNP